jgi:hypothetical protein
MAFEHLTRTAVDDDPSRRGSRHTGHAPRGIQEDDGDRKRHADRVYRSAALEQQGLVWVERSPAEPSHPFPSLRRHVHPPPRTAWTGDGQPSHLDERNRP